MVKLSEGGAERVGKAETQEEVERAYNEKVWGGGVPNVVQSIRGGDGAKKVSSLRRKLPGEVKSKDTLDKGGIGLYFKGFFG